MRSTAANVPHDAAIEQCLRRVVRDALKNDMEMTVKKARAHAEEELALDAGFFKDTPAWKERSKDIITAAVEDPSSPEKAQKNASKPTAKAKAGTKRKSDDAQPVKKRQKKAAPPASDEEDVVNDSE
ncbi:hypothetical protein EJ03DRAFT_266582, partial [Teratosphaeria nubilosa]